MLPKENLFSGFLQLLTKEAIVSRFENLFSVADSKRFIPDLVFADYVHAESYLLLNYGNCSAYCKPCSSKRIDNA